MSARQNPGTNIIKEDANNDKVAGSNPININNARFEITAVSPEQYPEGGLPEIAFVGRSNVGKSSIINALLNRNKLARVASTPGKTKEINFYNIDNSLRFVDLPGYGYASVSKSKKSSWGEIIETYLNTRNELKMLIMLVDIRHTPTSDDVLMHDWIQHSNLPYIVVATKADKISRNQLAGRLKDIRSALHTGENVQIIPFSSVSKQGRDEIWGKIYEFI
ncbi:MAG TPA: YihA family ribosome biogenesis GTP-binding protein [Clostridiaceae bacterium]|nr:YihA family ribosome biogenesis GTP-binding protein [Clostridiaceae bacterium]